MPAGELKETGIDYNNADSLRFQQYTRGYAAIAALYPANPAAKGDINLRGGIVQTQSGGDISILAPYGKVTVGYDAETASNSGKGGVVSRFDFGPGVWRDHLWESHDTAQCSQTMSSAAAGWPSGLKVEWYSLISLRGSPLSCHSAECFRRELSELGFGEFVNRKLINLAPAGSPPWGSVASN